MYLEFFKFKKEPFDITPDPDFLFLSPSHKEASASIFYGIQARKGFVAVIGEVGVGKTTILRSYLEGTDPEKIRIVYIFNSALSFEKLLTQICSDLGIQAEDEDPAELVNLLLNYLIDEYRKDRNVVLIIDEAQNMPVETLERLRMLSNLETSQDKLIQLILVGQPEFEAKLNLPELRQLKQRIAIRSRIEALTAEESIAYIYHRLMVASSFHNPVFTKKAMKHIIKQANGVPRAINILCDNSLVTAFGYLRKPVDEKIVKEVARDFRVKRPRLGLRWKIVLAFAAVACIAAAVFVPANVVYRSETPPMSKQTVRERLLDPPEATVKTGQSAKSATAVEKRPVALPPATVKAKQSAAAVEKKAITPSSVAVKAGQSANSPAPEKKAPAQIAAKPNKTPAVHVTEVSKESVSESKAAVGGVTPPVVSSSKGKPVPAALTAAPVGDSKSLSTGPPLSHPVVVQKGDNVTNLLLGVYGRVDDEMLRSFKDLNPKVKNINRLLVGEKIFLPHVEPLKQ